MRRALEGRGLETSFRGQAEQDPFPLTSSLPKHLGWKRERHAIQALDKPGRDSKHICFPGPLATVGNQKPKASNETLDILLQQVGKQRVKPEGQPQTKVSPSFRFLHEKLCPRPKGVKGVGVRGQHTPTGRKGLVHP